MALSTGISRVTKRNRHFNKLFPKVVRGKASLVQENLEDMVAYLQSGEKNSKRIALLAKIGLLGTVVLIVLLMIKMGNTSEINLRYSDQAHEQIGMWVIFIFVTGLISATWLIGSVLVKRKIKAFKTAAVSELRAMMVSASDNPGKRSMYESLLRQLDA